MTPTSVSEFYEEFHASRRKRGTVAVGERLAFLRMEIGSGHDVVELGCRDGSLLAHFHEGNRVTGCDIDRQALAACAQRFGIPTHVVNLNEPLPLPTAGFDVVVLSEVLEHLPYPAITLSEIVRILRPSGKFVGSVPNAVRLPNRLRFLFTGRVEVDPTHLHHFGSGTLGLLLSRYFSTVRVRPVAGRLAAVAPPLLANYLLFACEQPRREASAR